MNEKELKQTLESKKEDILKSFKDNITYEKWDKHSPVWAYNMLTSEILEITDSKRISYLLKLPQPYVKFFSTKQNVETYKWVQELIEAEIDNRIMESFSPGGYFDNFVDVNDINFGDKNCYEIIDSKGGEK